MSETKVESQVPAGQEQQVVTSADVFNKYSTQLSEKRAKKETPATPEASAAPVAQTPEVPKAETPTEVETIEAEAPKEPIANGKSSKPEVEVASVPEIKVPEDDNAWRKDLGFEDNTTVETVKAEVNEKEVVSTYKERVKELEDALADPFIAAYKAAKEAGKDVTSFIKEVKGTDVDALSQEQLWEINLKKHGLTPEEITSEMENFAELSPFEKRTRTNAVKQDLEKQQAEVLRKYADTTATSATEAKERAKAMAAHTEQQKKEFFNKIKDKEWQGIKMTASEAKKLENFLDTELSFQNADGSPNYELWAKVGNYALNERTILQNTYKKGETRGYEKALQELSRANKNDTKFNSAPDVKNKNKSELAKEAAKQAFAS